MILVSVGTQFPFDRLVSAVDKWAIENGRSDVIAQTGPSSYAPQALKSFTLMNPDQFRQLQIDAELLVAHAGMGSILTALEFGKPIVIMARDHARGEHRNGHQLATAEHFRNTPGVYVVKDEIELIDRLNHLDELVGSQGASKKAPEQFLSRLRSFIEEDAQSSVGWKRMFGRADSLSDRRR